MTIEPNKYINPLKNHNLTTHKKPSSGLNTLKKIQKALLIIKNNPNDHNHKPIAQFEYAATVIFNGYTKKYSEEHGPLRNFYDRIMRAIGFADRQSTYQEILKTVQEIRQNDRTPDQRLNLPEGVSLEDLDQAISHLKYNTHLLQEYKTLNAQSILEILEFDVKKRNELLKQKLNPALKAYLNHLNNNTTIPAIDLMRDLKNDPSITIPGYDRKAFFHESSKHIIDRLKNTQAGWDLILKLQKIPLYKPLISALIGEKNVFFHLEAYNILILMDSSFSLNWDKDITLQLLSKLLNYEGIEKHSDLIKGLASDITPKNLDLTQKQTRNLLACLNKKSNDIISLLKPQKHLPAILVSLAKEVINSNLNEQDPVYEILAESFDQITFSDDVRGFKALYEHLKKNPNEILTIQKKAPEDLMNDLKTDNRFWIPKEQSTESAMNIINRLQKDPIAGILFIEQLKNSQDSAQYDPLIQKIQQDATIYTKDWQDLLNEYSDLLKNISVEERKAINSLHQNHRLGIGLLQFLFINNKKRNSIKFLYEKLNPQKKEIDFLINSINTLNPDLIKQARELISLTKPVKNTFKGYAKKTSSKLSKELISLDEEFRKISKKTPHFPEGFKTRSDILKNIDGFISKNQQRTFNQIITQLITNSTLDIEKTFSLILYAKDLSEKNAADSELIIKSLKQSKSLQETLLFCANALAEFSAHEDDDDYLPVYQFLSKNFSDIPFKDNVMGFKNAYHNILESLP